MVRVVVDVNVLVSALLTPKGSPRRVLFALEHQRFSLVTSEGMIARVEEKLRNPKIGGAYGVTDEDIRSVRSLLRTQAEVVVVPTAAVVAMTGDPEDDDVLATAREGKATYLVTGDKEHLLPLDGCQGMRIVSPRQFLDILAEEEEGDL